MNPFITAPMEASVKENGLLTFTLTKGNAITLTDGAASGASDSLTLSVSHGTLTLGSTTGITFVSGSNNSSVMTIKGTLARLNAALRALKFTPTSGYAGFDRLLLALNNAGDGLTGYGDVAIRVNGQPSVTAPATAATVVNTALTFSTGNGNPITLTDATASGTSDSITLTVTHGTLTLVGIPGLTFTSGANGTSSMTVQGALARLNSALNGLVYTPTTGFTGSTSLKISLKNSLDGFTGSATIAISVSPAPAVAPSVANSPAIAADTPTTAPDEEATEWAGVMAAVEVLNG